MSMILPTNQPSDSVMFGSYTAPEPSFYVMLTALDVFSEAPVIQRILREIETLMASKNNQTVRALREAYCWGLISDVNLSTVTLSDSQQQGNVLLFKILPFILSGNVTLRNINTLTLSKTQTEYLRLIELLRYHNPMTFKCSKTWTAQSVHSVDDNVIEQLEKIPSIQAAAEFYGRS